MSLGSCGFCWEVHCECGDGHGWKHHSPAQLRRIAESIATAIEALEAEPEVQDNSSSEEEPLHLLYRERNIENEEGRQERTERLLRKLRAQAHSSAAPHKPTAPVSREDS